MSAFASAASRWSNDTNVRPLLLDTCKKFAKRTCRFVIFNGAALNDRVFLPLCELLPLPITCVCFQSYTESFVPIDFQRIETKRSMKWFHRYIFRYSVERKVGILVAFLLVPDPRHYICNALHTSLKKNFTCYHWHDIFLNACNTFIATSLRFLCFPEKRKTSVSPRSFSYF